MKKLRWTTPPTERHRMVERTPKEQKPLLTSCITPNIPFRRPLCQKKPFGPNEVRGSFYLPLTAIFWPKTVTALQFSLRNSRPQNVTKLKTLFLPGQRAQSMCNKGRQKSFFFNFFFVLGGAVCIERVVFMGLDPSAIKAFCRNCVSG